MHLAVTIQRKDLDELGALIAAVRNVLSAANVTIVEAPADMNFSYPMPIVTILEDAARRRLYGTDAVDKLRALADQHP